MCCLLLQGRIVRLIIYFLLDRLRIKMAGPNDAPPVFELPGLSRCNHITRFHKCIVVGCDRDKVSVRYKLCPGHMSLVNRFKAACRLHHEIPLDTWTPDELTNAAILWDQWMNEHFQRTGVELYTSWKILG